MGSTTASEKQGTGAADLAAMVIEAAKNYDGAALRYYDGDDLKDMSYEELGEAAREVAGGLIALGVEAGQRVAILSETRYEWTLADLGGILAGAHVVPIYQTASAEEAEHVLKDSEATVVFVEDSEKLETAREAAAESERRALRAVRRRGRRRDHARRAAREGAREGRRGRPAHRGHRARRRVHADLHVGHDRPAEGLRPHARELPRELRDADQRGRHRGRRGPLHLPAARARAVAHDADGDARRGRDAGLLARRQGQGARRPARDQADDLPVGPAHLREDLRPGAGEGRRRHQGQAARQGH